jgi:hypothetical protein
LRATQNQHNSGLRDNAISTGRPHARIPDAWEARNCRQVGDARRGAGVSPAAASSDAFSPDEKLVLEFAEAMSRTPAVIADELRRRLLNRFSPAQVTELAAAVAWENNRGRPNVIAPPPGATGWPDD